ncbi:MAG TPA: hypothetical protein IAB59_00190 [Candidatus Onthousia faecipullorum]|uniref:Uncharacterized protein n=1 Tax=Candidatus Onthousia faecipullorum TaxID=2840887 RepID=A0A9D1GAZ9_9FIRM|nr:hypothetical protein [Candidatus Onthousia faecipullorum]
MNKDIIEFYEEQKTKIQKEIDELWEVGKKSPARIKRLVEIEYILDGLNADNENMLLRNEIRDLKLRLKQEGIEVE